MNEQKVRLRAFRFAFVPRTPPSRSMRVIARLAILALAVWAFGAVAAAAGAQGTVKPTDRDKCPVCGMFVFKYPDWTAGVLFKDGTYAVFDGTKDLYKFLLDIKQYAPARGQADIDRFFVSDYYSVKQIDGRAAFYVIGSDIFGPMGKELIPFEQETDAREFLKDHKGKKVLRYREITPEVLKALE